MVNMLQFLLRNLRHGNSNGNVLDLKALYRGHKYVVETIKLPPEKPDPILLSTIFERISGLGRIHNPLPSLNSP
jgi:putative transposase